MALEEVDTNSLRNAITSCKNAINYSSEKQILNNISNEKNWKSASCNNLKTALTKLIETRYKSLETKLDSYYKIVSYIEDYQKLNQQNEKYENQRNEIRSKIANNRYLMTDENKDEVIRNEMEMAKQSNSLKNNISYNKYQMKEIKQKIANLI